MVLGIVDHDHWFMDHRLVFSKVQTTTIRATVDDM